MHPDLPTQECWARDGQQGSDEAGNTEPKKAEPGGCKVLV